MAYPQASSTAEYGKTSKKADLFPQSRDREKGIWNFLVWSLFLSQVLTADGAFALGAHATNDDSSLSHGDGTHDASTDAGVSPGLPSLLGLLGGGEGGAGASAHDASSATLQAAQVLHSQVSEHAPAKLAAIDAHVPHEGDASLGVDPASAAPAEVGQNAPDDGATATGDSGLAGLGLPDPGSLIGALGNGLSEVVGDLSHGAVETLTGTLGDLGGAVQALAGDVVSPVLSEVGGLTQSLGDTLGTTVQSLADDVVSPVLSEVGGLTQALGDTLGTTVQSLAGDVVSPVLSEVGDLTQALGDTLGTTVQSLAGDVVAPILSDIGLVLDPGEVLGDLGNGALSSLTAPLDDAGQIVQSLAADVAGPLASDVGGLVQPVGDVLGQLANIGLSLDADGTLGSLGHSLPGLLGDATDTAQASGLPDVSGPALTAPIGDILASAPTVADLAQPVGDIAASALPQVSSLLGGLDGLGESTGIQLDAGQADSLSSIGGSLTGALDDIVGSGGSLALNPPVLGSATIDDLFNSAGYTNYNLSLQAESPGTTGQLPGPVIADATTLLDQILGEPDHTDTSISSHDTQQQTQLVSLPSAIEDLLTRGHGDLL